MTRITREKQSERDLRESFDKNSKEIIEVVKGRKIEGYIIFVLTEQEGELKACLTLNTNDGDQLINAFQQSLENTANEAKAIDREKSRSNLH